MIFLAIGQMIRSRPVSAAETSGDAFFPTPFHSSGIYFLPGKQNTLRKASETPEG